MKRIAIAAAALTAVLGTPVLAETALTVYNQDFAVVREDIPLNLQAGQNTVSYNGVTLHLEPDSVVLRDPEGRTAFSILEQGYRADVISQGLLLSLYEGETIDFLVRDSEGREFTVPGRVVRSGYMPAGGSGRYGPQYYARQGAPGNWQLIGGGAPVIEVDGQLRFSLPGEPIFPALRDDSILEPTLTWVIQSPRAARLDAELSYVTGGLTWAASYNLVAPEDDDVMDIVGWVTIDNHSGTTFEDARLKLMAGDVNKLQPDEVFVTGSRIRQSGFDSVTPQVTERAFDEFHLYSLPRPTTLRDSETKQVEFIRATGVEATTFYVYNGAYIDPNRYRGYAMENIRNDPNYGTESNPKVWVMREFENTEANGLGLPLPQGRTRFYRQNDDDNSLEFTGENVIDHTPRNETVRIYTGDAFDIVGERRRTNFVMSSRNDFMEEAFEIRVRNRKDEAVEVRVAEGLYRGVNWRMLAQSHQYREIDAQNIEFRVDVPADGETVVEYRVRYDWQ